MSLLRPFALIALLTLPPVQGATLGETVAAALAHVDQSGRVTALRAEGAAVRDHAGGLIAEDPALRLKGLSDHMTENAGAYELEAMVDLPLMLPGQRGARRTMADTIGARADALDHLLRWEMAGKVREAAWDTTIANGRLRQAAAALDAARTLEATVAKRTAAGELARIDLLVAKQETLTRAAELTAAQAEYDGAIAAFIHLTGQPMLPEPLLEPEPALPQPVEIPADHPLLTSAEGALAGARAERDRVDADRRGHPVLSLGGKRARDDRHSETLDAIQLELSIPFGLKGQSAPALAAAERDYTERLTDLHLIRHEAEHDLESAVLARQSAAALLAAAQERAGLTEQALALTRRAFELGEGDLAALLRAEENAREARLELELRRLEQGRAVARLNQALGVIPQ